MSERASEGGLDELSTVDKVVEDASTKFFVGTEVRICTRVHVVLVFDSPSKHTLSLAMLIKLMYVHNIIRM